ncbi:MAG: DUF3048 domain-containing protein [Acidimicrobiales bacterium]
MGPGQRRLGFTAQAAIAAAFVLSSSLLASCAGGRHQAATTTTSAPPTTLPATTTSTTLAPPPVAPLTGLPEPNPAQQGRPAVVVKIGNTDQARPQSGVGQADIVYEELVEGGLSRLAAVFQSNYPSQVGPVRSGRTTDLGIIDDLNKPVFAFAGANGLFLPKIRNQPIVDLDENNHGELFHRLALAPAPNNLYTNVQALANAAPPGGGPPAQLFSYRPASAAPSGAGVSSASRVNLSFPAAGVAWTWSAAGGLWQRVQNGTPDVDRAGEELGAANVIVQVVPYVTVAYANESGVITPIPEGQLLGSGPAWLFSAGKVVKGTWSRASLTAPTSWSDAGGAPFALSPGGTWIELLPAGASPFITP